MNKKYIVIISVIIAIGAIVLSGYTSIPNNKSEEKSTINTTNNLSANTAKHFSIDLNESVGIKTKP